MNLFKIIAWIPILVLAFFVSVVYVPVFFEHEPLLPYPDSLNLFLTVAITSFAFVEGYSTYKQVVLSEDRNSIEDAKNELEKAYGPLYSWLNVHQIIKELNGIQVFEEDKKSLDKIFATYPFMFPSEIYGMWRKKIQNIECKMPKHIDAGITNDRHTFRTVHYCLIPLDFGEIINKEYERRVERYNKLLKK